MQEAKNSETVPFCKPQYSCFLSSDHGQFLKSYLEHCTKVKFHPDLCPSDKDSL